MEQKDNFGQIVSRILNAQMDTYTRKTKMTNRAKLERAKELGFNMIHPVPPSTSYALDGDDNAIETYFKDAEELGIGVMYDMRHGKHPTAGVVII